MYKEYILKFVRLNPGIGNVQLSLKILSELGPVIFEYGIFIKSIIELMDEKEIISIEYSNNINFMRGSLYFPKGTIITVYDK